MPWVRKDDHTDDHPKVMMAGSLGETLWDHSIQWCNRNLTDGFIPAAVAYRMAADVLTREPWCTGGSPEALIERLVNARLTPEGEGLWVPAEGGYQIHDYLEYQPSAAKVKSDRAVHARRVKAWRDARVRGGVTASRYSHNSARAALPVPVPVPESGPANNGNGPFGPAEFVALWNEYPFVKCRALTPGRRTRIEARLRDRPGRAAWVEVFHVMAQRSFLLGDNDRGWRADLDWILKPESALRVLEGTYDSRRQSRTAGDRIAELLGGHHDVPQP